MTPEDFTKWIDKLLAEVHRLRHKRWAVEWANGKHEDAPPPPKMKGKDEERNAETVGNGA